MKYLLGLLLCLVALWGVARADVLAPPAFTQEFARALTKAMPSSSVRVTGAMTVTVEAASGRSWSLFLGNTYEDYKKNPALFDEIVRAYLTRLSQPPNREVKLDRPLGDA